MRELRPSRVLIWVFSYHIIQHYKPKSELERVFISSSIKKKKITVYVMISNEWPEIYVLHVAPAQHWATIRGAVKSDGNRIENAD